MENRRVIFHVDANSFYASCLQAQEPEKYAGKPIAVGGNQEERKGIIVTASYEARIRNGKKTGLRAGMTINEAKRLVPDLIIVQPDFDLFRQYSRHMLRVAYGFTPIIEPVSIDEFYMDMTGALHGESPVNVDQTLQQEIKEQVGIPVSIGISNCKLLAKHGSDFKKPMGITFLDQERMKELLWPLPVGELFGIGSKTAAKLNQMGIKIIRDLAYADEQALYQRFGVNGPRMKEHANGIDYSVVDPDAIYESKSIGHSTTLPKDETDITEIRRIFLNLADQVGRKMRKKGYKAKTVTITIRDSRFKTITRSKTLDEATDLSEVLYEQAVSLFLKHWHHRPIRLLGLSVSNLVETRQQEPVQLSLFGQTEEEQKKEKYEKLTRAVDAIRDKYGEEAIIKAAAKQSPSMQLLRHKERGTSLDKGFIDEKRE